ncbi:uncharacterized protein LOC111059350 [Nilaparvata lugens]|uniref:uncharacterized protein LOC111059350 n=1 Tax=Nilaparvata lugens TaxID=108931 RepID=UPI00193E5240|nr:uncharacterized protein LOC111059350 [Nilaparvata lugens]
MVEIVWLLIDLKMKLIPVIPLFICMGLLSVQVRGEDDARTKAAKLLFKSITGNRGTVDMSKLAAYLRRGNRLDQQFKNALDQAILRSGRGNVGLNEFIQIRLANPN